MSSIVRYTTEKDLMAIPVYDDVEEWRPLVGWEKYYEVSSHGRVRTLPQQYLKMSRIRNPGISGYGYFNLKLHYRDNCVSLAKTYYIHKMVAEAFIPNPDGKIEVNHIDGNKLNNHYTNLEWVTHIENCTHAFLTRINSRERKLTDQQIQELRSYRGPLNHRQLAEKYGISRRYCSQIINDTRLRTDIYRELGKWKEKYKNLENRAAPVVKALEEALAQHEADKKNLCDKYPQLAKKFEAAVLPWVTNAKQILETYKADV